MQEFDLVVIGAGPGGYVAAIKAAQLGLKVACVDKRETLGGTCLNVGCIPSKALLYSSEKYHEAAHTLKNHGILAENLKLDLSQMMARKEKVVKELTEGIYYLFKKNKVTFFCGDASFIDQNHLKVEGKDSLTLKSRFFVIATGSKSINLPGIEVDEIDIVSSTGALEFKEVPKSLAVIGGGYIGLELGSVWQRLGAQVTVIEYAESITPQMDKEIAAHLLKSLKKQGLEFMLGTKVEKVEKTRKNLMLTLVSAKGEKLPPLEVEKVLCSIGRLPSTEGLGLEKINVQKGPKGDILVNSAFQTSVENIFAIGDVIKGPMLAHKAEEEGIAVAEHLSGKYGHVNYQVIPAVIYTSPEVASVGKTEEELKQEGRAYKAGKFPFSANSRAKAVGQTEGLVKVLADTKTDRILGVHIIGMDAGTLIAEIAVAMEFSASSEDIARTCHAHPTLNEAIKEAALMVEGAAIHI